MKNPIPWTEADTDLARQMLADKEPDIAFMETPGRSRQSARDRVKRMRAKANMQAEKRKQPERVVVPMSVYQDAARRAIVPRSLTARTFGDPPPGYSALDRRNRAEASL